jgi:hypothetical protein
MYRSSQKILLLGKMRQVDEGEQARAYCPEGVLRKR